MPQKMVIIHQLGGSQLEWGGGGGGVTPGYGCKLERALHQGLVKAQASGSSRYGGSLCGQPYLMSSIHISVLFVFVLHYLQASRDESGGVRRSILLLERLATRLETRLMDITGMCRICSL